VDHRRLARARPFDDGHGLARDIQRIWSKAWPGTEMMRSYLSPAAT
jgi:hypothetical protein